MEVVRLCSVSLVCVCSPGCVIVCVGLGDFVCVFAHECVAASECALVCVQAWVWMGDVMHGIGGKRKMYRIIVCVRACVRMCVCVCVCA